MTANRKYKINCKLRQNWITHKIIKLFNALVWHKQYHVYNFVIKISFNEILNLAPKTKSGKYTNSCAMLTFWTEEFFF